MRCFVPQDDKRSEIKLRYKPVDCLQDSVRETRWGHRFIIRFSVFKG